LFLSVAIAAARLSNSPSFSAKEIHLTFEKNYVYQFGRKNTRLVVKVRVGIMKEMSFAIDL